MKKIIGILLILLLLVSCSNDESKGTVNETEIYKTQTIEKEYDRENIYNYQEYSYWYVVYELSGIDSDNKLNEYNYNLLNQGRFRCIVLIKNEYNFLPIDKIINQINDKHNKKYKEIIITNFIRISKETYEYSKEDIYNLYIKKTN
jgi:hypothetical protein